MRETASSIERAASRNVDKSVKVSLNLKSVSNQIDRCNNIQKKEGGGGREKRGNFHDATGYKRETLLRKRKNNILTLGVLFQVTFHRSLSIVVELIRRHSSELCDKTREKSLKNIYTHRGKKEKSWE